MRECGAGLGLQPIILGEWFWRECIRLKHVREKIEFLKIQPVHLPFAEA